MARSRMLAETSVSTAGTSWSRQRDQDVSVCAGCREPKQVFNLRLEAGDGKPCREGQGPRRGGAAIPLTSSPFPCLSAL